MNRYPLGDYGDFGTWSKNNLILLGWRATSMVEWEGLFLSLLFSFVIWIYKVGLFNIPNACFQFKFMLTFSIIMRKAD